MVTKFIKRYKLLFWLFVLCLLTAFLIAVPLSTILEVFKYGSEIGKIVYDISIGYIVSYIFFYLVVFIKEEKDRNNINHRASLQATFIVLDSYSLFDIAFHDVTHLKKQFPPTFDEVHEACLSIDPFASSGMSIANQYGTKPATWQYILRSRREENLNHIEKVMALLPFIDSELVGILTRIEDCMLHYEATNRVFPQQKVPHFKDGTFMEKALFDYFILINELEKYIRKNFPEMTAHINLLNETNARSFRQ
ncbi:MAG TPA: hypothetical protein VHB48_09065 [Chitinophagaceae bacterium]|nr:hypothetical protein [Chitinophagaceae bacterium]